ncbi:MAG TPA: Rieske 2Fe-2S domain-containing protein, partial [Chloroflexota bacterium]|nr:Rieske 2Fe-2S domain-containing protein [Chloroflexota bacterium]
MLSREENELLTRTGPGTSMGQLVRRYWVPTLYSQQLPKPDCPPVRVRLLGEDLIAVRDTSGRVGLLGQHCPHRGASLFFGRNEECGLRCVYHGWKFDVHGTCVDMPNEPPESNFKHKIQQLAYPCRERGGVIWSYLGPPELEPGLPELEWALVPDSQRFATRHIQTCNWLQALEDGFDTSHVQILHQGFVQTVRAVSKAPKLEVIPSAGGFMLATSRELQAGGTNWSINQWLFPWYKVITRHGPDEPIGAHAWVPIDDESCMVWTVEYHPDRPLNEEEMGPSKSWTSIHLENIPGSDRTVLNKKNDYLIDRQVQRTQTYTGIKGIGAQDTAMQESMGPIY